MLMSMTGFGRAVLESKTHKITVEIKSLNSKQLDLNVRLPFILRESEIEVRNIVSRTLERGKVDVNVIVENLPSAAVTSVSELNVEAMAAYKAQVENAAQTLGVDLPTDMFRLLISLPEAVKTPIAEAAEDDNTILLKGVRQAADALMSHRRAEGLELEDFFRKRVVAIGDYLKQVEPFEKERVEHVRSRLEDSLSKIPAVEFDKGRLEQELIFYIEKLDVNEEKQRLRKHLDYFLETMDATKPGQGKKLGFIAQEMGREINTLGSKSNHAEMQAIVVKMKDLLEQIKEQVLNVM